VVEAALPVRGAIEALLRYLNDDSVLSVIPPEILDRMLGNADTILSIEGPSFAGWRPTIEQLADIAVPVGLIVADDTLPFYKQLSRWLAEQLGIEPVRVSGRHGFYYYRPHDLADALRTLLAPAQASEVCEFD
jgi:hypothetical protein